MTIVLHAKTADVQKACQEITVYQVRYSEKQRQFKSGQTSNINPNSVTGAPTWITCGRKGKYFLTIRYASYHNSKGRCCTCMQHVGATRSKLPRLRRNFTPRLASFCVNVDLSISNVFSTRAAHQTIAVLMEKRPATATMRNTVNSAHKPWSTHVEKEFITVIVTVT